MRVIAKRSDFLFSQGTWRSARSPLLPPRADVLLLLLLLLLLRLPLRFAAAPLAWTLRVPRFSTRRASAISWLSGPRSGPSTLARSSVSAALLIAS